MAAIRGNRGFVAGLTVFFISIGAAMAFQAGDLVEMTEFVNGRSGRNFYNSARNINFIVPKGSEGKVRDVRRLKSGNFGVLITVQNGKHKGRSVWVYYNPQEPWMKLLKPARKPARASSRGTPAPETRPAPPPATQASAPPPSGEAGRGEERRVETRDPREATEVQTTRDQQGVADPQSPDEMEKLLHSEAAHITASKIDLVTAEQCSQVLDRAAAAEGYPPGYVAAMGANARGETGAYLFDHKTARFFKGLTPFSRDGEFREFFAGARESFDVPMSAGVEDLSDRSRAFLAQHLIRKIATTFFNFVRAAEEAAAPPKEQEREQADLVAMIDEANGLKKAKEISLLDDKMKEALKIADASLEAPTSRRLPPPDFGKLAVALSVCSKVVGEPNVSMLANQMLGAISGQGAAPRAPEPVPEGGQPEAAPAH